MSGHGFGNGGCCHSDPYIPDNSREIQALRDQVAYLMEFLKVPPMPPPPKGPTNEERMRMMYTRMLEKEWAKATKKKETP